MGNPTNKLPNPDSFLVFTADGAIHQFYGFYNFDNCYNVLDHAWRASFSDHSPLPMPVPLNQLLPSPPLLKEPPTSQIVLPPPPVVQLQQQQYGIRTETTTFTETYIPPPIVSTTSSVSYQTTSPSPSSLQSTTHAFVPVSLPPSDLPPLSPHSQTTPQYPPGYPPSGYPPGYQPK